MMQTKKKIAAGLTALALAAGAVPAQAAATTYLDVEHKLWYAPAVEFCQQHDLMDGASDTAFEPDTLMTRATLVEALYRLAGCPAAEGEGFPDVGEDHPNRAAVIWAAANDVVNGYPDGRFGPEDPITREQIAGLLWKAQGRQAAAEAEAYEDGADISDWAREAVNWARNAGVMQGSNENRFNPLSNASRADGATLVMNYAKQFHGVKEGYPLPDSQLIPANRYDREGYAVDEKGYLTYQGEAPGYRGIDVSAHQKVIDWTLVGAAGLDFAMIRAGYRGYTKGAIVKDEYFDANMRGALDNGMQVGVYFFSQAVTPAEAEEEARIVLEWIAGYPVTYPIVFDWERQNYDTSRTQGAGGNTVTACARAFCKVISDAGYIPMTYGSPSKVYQGGLQLDRLQEYPAFWLAHYTIDMLPTSFRYHYSMWQYSSTGHVDGIEGNVDLNICHTDWSTWKNSGVSW